MAAKEPVKPRSADEVFIVLAFSGGGTRSVAFAYGVLPIELKIAKDHCVHGPFLDYDRKTTVLTVYFASDTDGVTQGDRA
ncbi:MAG TPA: hypothetical protein VIE47_04270 [Methylocystis sp.]|jgi:hypothetical protein